MTRLKQYLWIGGLVFLLSRSAGPFAFRLYWQVHLPAVRRASHEPWHAQDLTCGQAFQAYPTHEDNYYYFQLEETSTITVSLEGYAPNSSNGDLLLYRWVGGDKRWLRIMQYGKPDEKTSMSLGPCSLKQGEYLVQVHTAGNYSLEHYTLTVDCVLLDSDPETPCPTPAQAD